eukprot:PhM_4_TR18727/c0_g1_i1/m.11700
MSTAVSCSRVSSAGTTQRGLVHSRPPTAGSSCCGDRAILTIEDMFANSAQSLGWVSRARVGSAGSSRPTSASVAAGGVGVGELQRASTPLRPDVGPIGPQRFESRPGSAATNVGGGGGAVSARQLPPRPGTAGGSAAMRRSINREAAQRHSHHDINGCDRLDLEQQQASEEQVEGKAGKEDEKQQQEAALPPTPPKAKKPVVEDWATVPQSLEDQFSVRERTLVKELNVLRRDPRGYGAMLLRDGRIDHPFLPAPATLDAARAILKELKTQLSSVTTAISSSGDDFAKTVADQKQVWAQEDAVAAQKAAALAKQAKNKKMKDVDLSPPGPSPEAIAAERAAVLSKMEKDFNKTLDGLNKESARLTVAIADAEEGIARFTDALRVLSCAAESLPQLVFSRGLTLEARDECIRQQDGSLNNKTQKANHSQQQLTRTASFVLNPIIHNAFGVAIGPTSRFLTVDTKSCLETVCFWLCDRGARSVLLSHSTLYVGVGWRRHPVHRALTVCVTAEHFQESHTSSSLVNVPLQVVRRRIDDNNKNNKGKKPPQQPERPPSAALMKKQQLREVPLHEVTFVPGAALQPVFPSFHPQATTNSHTVLVKLTNPEVVAAADRCKTHIGVHAAVGALPTRSELHARQSIDCLVERAMGSAYVRITVLFPSPGRHTLSLFLIDAHHKKGDEDESFQFVGTIDFIAAADDWDYAMPPRSFPRLFHAYYEHGVVLKSPVHSPIYVNNAATARPATPGAARGLGGHVEFRVLVPPPSRTRGYQARALAMLESHVQALEAKLATLTSEHAAWCRDSTEAIALLAVEVNKLDATLKEKEAHAAHLTTAIATTKKQTEKTRDTAQLNAVNAEMAPLRESFNLKSVELSDLRGKGSLLQSQIKTTDTQLKLKRKEHEHSAKRITHRQTTGNNNSNNNVVIPRCVVVCGGARTALQLVAKPRDTEDSNNNNNNNNNKNVFFDDKDITNSDGDVTRLAESGGTALSRKQELEDDEDNNKHQTMSIITPHHNNHHHHQVMEELQTFEREQCYVFSSVVKLRPGSASLLVDGDCIAQWSVQE